MTAPHRASTLAGMRRYRPRPVEIEAVQLTADNAIDVAQWCGGIAEVTATDPERPVLRIPTSAGTFDLAVGDYLIRLDGHRPFERRDAIEFEHEFEPVPEA